MTEPDFLSTMLTGIDAVIWLAVAVATSFFFFTAWQRTRMSGLLWLLAAVIAWPTVARVLAILLISNGPRISGSFGWSGETFSQIFRLFNIGDTALGGILLIVAAVVLTRQMRQRFTQPTVPAAAYPGQSPPYTASAASIPR